MTISDWINTATKQLAEAGITTARLDVLVLLEDCLHTDRAHLLAHPELGLTLEQQKQLAGQLEARAQHIPLAYIRGRSEFYGREFVVNHNVLEPRPESETMIDLLKKLHLPADAHIIDVGTGSGALAITAKLELPEAAVSAIDIDPACLEIAKSNAQKYGAEITFYKGDLAQPLLDNSLEAGALLCNLPYVPDGFHINPAAMNEPHIAIFGGPDGLDLYRQLFAQLQKMPHAPRFVLTESLPPQHEELAGIASAHGYAQNAEDDFIQVFAHTL